MAVFLTIGFIQLLTTPETSFGSLVWFCCTDGLGAVAG
jgi:NhaP-type Na+/H+ and K+/H+ antiporter